MKVKNLILRLKYFEGAVPWEKRTVDTSDGVECKKNQKYEADRVERTLNEIWNTGLPWLLLSVL